MIYNYFSNPVNVLQFLRIFIALSLCVSSVQNISNSTYFSSGGLMDWALIKGFSRSGMLKGKIGEYIFNKKGFIALNILRILILPFFYQSSNELFFFNLIFLNLVNWLIYIRTNTMHNAADQMNNIVLIGLLIGQVFMKINSIELVIVFFGLTLILNYFTSGISKFHQEKWHNGYYLRTTLLYRNLENPSYRKAIKKIDKSVFKISSLIIVYWQVSSVFMPFLPPTVLLVYLFIGFWFHVSTGILLGLNNFIWTFIGLMPTLIFINSKVYPLL